jgi:hypothetical protein
MMTIFMDFWLCSVLTILLLNVNTNNGVSLLGVVKNYALATEWLGIDTVTTAWVVQHKMGRDVLINAKLGRELKEAAVAGFKVPYLHCPIRN